MRIKIVLIAAAILLQFHSSAQLSNSTFVYQKYNQQLDSFNGYILNSSYQLGSSSLNTGMFSDYLFSDRFNPKNSAAFKESNIQNSRLRSLNINELRFVNSTDKKYWEISIDFRNAIYTKLSKPLSQLLLFGNKTFANQNITSKTNHFLDINYSTVNFTKTAINSNNWQVQWKAGLAFIYGYANYAANELSIFTEQDGNYLDVSVIEGRYSEKNAGLDGLGLNLGLNISRALNHNQKLSVQINQISPTILFNKSEHLLDTSFRFDGIELGVEDFESDNFNNLLDSLYESLIRGKSEMRNFIFLPIEINLNYFYELKNENIIHLGISSTDLGRNGLSVELNYIHNLNQNTQWTSSMSYGLFTQFYLSQQIEILFANKWHANCAVHGINAVILPRNSNFYGASIGVAMEL